MKIYIFRQISLIWKNATYPQTITLRKISALGRLCNGLCGSPTRKFGDLCRLTIFLREQLCWYFGVVLMFGYHRFLLVDNVFARIQDYKWLARLIQGKTLRTTIRSFVKMFMKRELAVQFSWSGLGDKRASNAKVCFRDHDIRAVLDSK